MPCVVAQDGDAWTVDETHQSYPMEVRQAPPDCLAGTALKSLLASIGIASTPNCACNARARDMDTRGCDWCEQNMDTIVGWLREQAEARGLPFLDAVGRMLVRRAIRNARRAAAN